MASPPGTGATSPPGPTPLTLPKQRPSIALPGLKRRKPSIASNTSSAHPLRQTSFPPPESLEAQHAAAALDAYSPSQASPSQASGLDDFSDTEIQSAISGPAEDGATRKRKRGEKRPRGRPARHSTARTGSVSLVNGDDGTPTSKRPGAPSVVTADNADDEEDPDADDDGDDGLVGGRAYETGQLDPSEQEKDNLHKSMFRKYMDVIDTLPLNQTPDRNGLSVADMGERYDVWNRAKLRTGDLRRLVNQTLSQSVPANVVTVVNSYTKMFAGMLIEEAREVQAEWLAMEAKRADGGANAAHKRLKRTYEDEEEQDETPTATESNTQANGVKQQPSSPTANIPDSVPNSDTQMQNSNPQSSATLQESQNALSTEEVYPGGVGGLSTSISECDRGPLLPDHLREALRRHKKARKGGTVGFTGLSLEGRELAASRMGGRRLFR